MEKDWEEEGRMETGRDGGARGRERKEVGRKGKSREDVVTVRGEDRKRGEMMERIEPREGGEEKGSEKGEDGWKGR